MKTKKLLALLLAASMTIPMVTTTVAAEEEKEPVTLDVFAMPSNTSGIQENWYADILEEKFGVKLNLLPSGDQGEQKLQALMASGELPDIVVFKEYSQVANAVAGDMLLAYDDYKDLVPNLYTYADKSLQYMADNVSEGKGKAYAVGNNINTALPERGTLNWGPYLRYDLYKQIGSPEIKTYTDFLEAVKQMVELEPTNADGKKNYGFSLWSDWDSTTAMLVECVGNLYGRSYDEARLAELDVATGEMKAVTDPESWYMKGINFFYQANQMGLLDPDSMIQRFDDAVAKMSEGRTMFTFWEWATGTFDNPENHANKVGFRAVMAEDEKVLSQQLCPIGRTWTTAVSSATEYPELCMQVVDYLYSPEGTMTMLNGPEGVCWNINADGVPELTEDGYAYINDPTKELPGGGSLSAAGSIFNAPGLNGNVIHPEYNEPLASSQWSTFKQSEDALKEEWREDYGVFDQLELVRNRDAIAQDPFAPMPIMPDDMTVIASNVGNVVQPMTWKMIYAKDQAEYDALYEQMVEQATDAGIDEFVEWAKGAYAEAKEIGAKYE